MGYVTSGYVTSGYVRESQKPTENIVSISRSIFLNNIDITSFVTELEIDRQLNRAFTVLTITIQNYQIDSAFLRNKDILIEVNIGENTDNFIIFDIDTDYKNVSKIIGKSRGCLLDEPFSKVYDDVFEGGANDILNELTNEINSNISTPTFEFNEGSFKLQGSKLDGIKKLIAVGGGVFYEANDILHVETALSIRNQEIDLEIIDSILIEKDFSDNFNGSTLVDKVTFNASNNDLLSEPKITLCYEENSCNRPYFLFNPSPINLDSIISNLGAIHFSIKRQIFSGNIENSNTILVSGGIIEILSITVNGTALSGYSFTERLNGIVLDTSYTGLIEVIYTTKVIANYSTNGEFNFVDRVVKYEIEYLTQVLSADVPMCAEVVTFEGLSSFSIELVDKGITLDTDTQFDIIGNVENLALVSDKLTVPTIVNGYYAYGDFDTEFMDTISIEEDLIVDRNLTTTLENVTENMENATESRFGFFTTRDIEISNAFVGSIEITLTKDESNSDYYIYYTIDSLFNSRKISCVYSAVVDRWTIPAVGVDNTVQNIDWYSESGIHSFNYPDRLNGTYAGICIVPADIELDVSSLLDVDPRYLSGQSIIYDEVTYTINAVGFTSIHVAKAESIAIDTTAFRKGSKITIDSTNSEVSE